MKNLFKRLTQLWAALPGAAILVTGISTPPGCGLLFGGIIEFVCLLALLLLYVNQKSLRRVSRKRITRFGILFGGMGLFFLLVYLFVIASVVFSKSAHVKEWSNHRVYFPIRINGNIKKAVENAGGPEAAINKYGPVAVEKMLAKMKGLSFWRSVTTTLLIFLYTSFFLLITLAFGFPGFHVTNTPLAEPESV